MKNIKKLTSVILAVVLILAMSSVAFAAPGKLLFGGVPAFYISFVGWFIPLYAILIAWYQSRCISKAANEAIASGKYDTQVGFVTN